MKRVISMGLILSGFLWLFGCTQGAGDSKMKEFHYNVQVCGYTDSVPGAEYSLEFPLWYSESYEENKLKGEKFEWKKDDISLTGTYKDSAVRKYEYDPTHRFEGKDGHDFEIDENGTLVYFYLGWERDDSAKQSFSQEQCVEIAKKFFLKMVENADSYRVTVMYNDTFKDYSVIFTKYVDSWKTADQAEIRVNPTTGKIFSYRATMIEQMDANAKLNLDQAKLDAVVTEKLDQIFEKAKEKYDEVNYGEYSYVLTKVSESEYAVVCEVSVDCVEKEGEYNMVFSGSMSFVIT